MRIDAPWLSDPAVQSVFAMLAEAGFQAFAVGGCVRNTLLNAPISDIDFATDATPNAVMSLAEAKGFNAIPTGIDHGTVTVARGGAAYEITTFRRDVETDGRRAVVAFSGSAQEDAARRDFTMNALYVSGDGEVLDPVGGLPDVETRRVRFIGSAEERIREDYLRTLRFFRFHALYADPTHGFDTDALAAIALTLDGLETLSAERVGHEILKLLGAPDPASAGGVLERIGVMARVVPGATSESLAVLVHLEQGAGVGPQPLRRLAVLGGLDTEALRLSRADARRFSDIRIAALSDARAAELGYRKGQDIARDALLVRGALLSQPLPDGWLADAARGAAAKFPIAADDLMPSLSGKALGEALTRLEAEWVASDFTLDREALLSRL